MAGQILQSNGSGVSPTWVTPGKIFPESSAGFGDLITDGKEMTITSITVNVARTSYVEVHGTMWLYSAGCFWLQ